MLTIYKASAGSGKTYTLALEYIKTLLGIKLADGSYRLNGAVPPRLANRHRNILAITFTNAATPVVYYNQTDARWGNKLYGRTGTIGWEGCGPTALAIVVASMTPNKVTPYDVAQWSVQNGYRCEGNGSYRTLIPNGGAHYGLTVTDPRWV